MSGLTDWTKSSTEMLRCFKNFNAIYRKNECHFRCWNSCQKHRKPWSKYKFDCWNKWLHVFELYVHEILPACFLFKEGQENSLSVMTRFVRNCDWDKSAEQALLPKINLKKKSFLTNIWKRVNCWIKNSECV